MADFSTSKVRAWLGQMRVAAALADAKSANETSANGTSAQQRGCGKKPKET